MKHSAATHLPDNHTPSLDFDTAGSAQDGGR
jgi:hypothetical protein